MFLNFIFIPFLLKCFAILFHSIPKVRRKILFVKVFRDFRNFQQKWSHIHFYFPITLFLCWYFCPYCESFYFLFLIHFHIKWWENLNRSCQWTSYNFIFIFINFNFFFLHLSLRWEKFFSGSQNLKFHLQRWSKHFKIKIMIIEQTFL